MSPMIFILVIGGALVLTLMVVGIYVTSTSEHALVEERLGRYLGDKSEQKKKKVDKDSAVSEWLNPKLERSNWGSGIAKELARADLKLKVYEYVLLLILSAAGVGLGFWFFGGRSILFAIIGVVIGLFIPRMYVRRMQGLRLRRFNEQLPDMLNLAVNGLRAGYSILQAMEAVSREMPPPIADEFRRVVQEMQLGLSMDRALENLLRRIPSDDLDLVITAMSVQREVGGNLADILDTISYTIRERVRIKGEIRVLTSQVMYSGRFLSMMPVFIILALWFMNRPYMMEFFNPETRVFGIIALAIGGSMVLAGYFVMTRIASIEV